MIIMMMMMTIIIISLSREIQLMSNTKCFDITVKTRGTGIVGKILKNLKKISQLSIVYLQK
jgi:ribosomal protein S9